MNSNWLRIIGNWRSEGMGNNGCTLPYLVGIESIISSSNVSEPSDIAVIITYAAYNKDGQAFWLRMCNNIKHPVLQITNKKSADDFGATWIGNLLIEDSFFWKGNSLDSVIEMLIEENAGKIKDQRFSFHHGNFIKYTTKDIDFIQKVLNIK